MINRSYTWSDDSIEHSQEDCDMATVLAKRWSAIKTKQENRAFERQAMREDGEDPDYAGEGEECEACEGAGTDCPNPHCENGYDMEIINKQKAYRRQEIVEEDLDLSMIEERLEKIGARIMRPYEHWNEEETFMAHAEGEYGY